MSMELIDRRKAISHITACDGKSAQIEALENMPTVKAIPIEKLEQMRDHFELLAHFDGTMKADYVVNMLDKAIKEQSK